MSLISFAMSHSSSIMTGREGIKEREDDMMGGGGGDYSREVIFLKISKKGGQLFEGGD